MSEFIFPDELQSLGFYCDEKMHDFETWIYELDNFAIVIEYKDYQKIQKLYLYEPDGKGQCIEIPTMTINRIKNLIKAGQ